MRRLIAVLGFMLWSATALAQNPGIVYQGTSPAANDCVKFVNRTLVTTAGGPCVTGSPGLVIGSTTITGGTSTRVLYDNAGVLGEYTNIQLTALINPATVALSGALPAWPGNTTTFFRGDGTYAALPSSFSGLANPTASVGLTAVNGVATTAMRSDGAPALDVTAAYAFTGLGKTVVGVAGAASLPPLSITGTWFSGGSATTTKPQVLIEPVGTTSTTWNTSGTGLGINAASGFGGLLVDAKLNNATQFSVSRFGTIVSAGGAQLEYTSSGNYGLDIASGSNYITFQTGATSPALGLAWTAGSSTSAQDLFVTYGGAAKLQLGPANAASPVAQTLQAQGSRAGTDNNVAGAAFAIQPGAGTGSVTPALLVLRTYTAVGSGTGVQTITDALTLDGTQTATFTGIIKTTITTDSTTTTSGALQVAGGAAIRKRVWMDGLTTTTSSQSAYVCQASTGELVADTSITNLCVASSRDFKHEIESLTEHAVSEVLKLRPVSFKYKPEGRFRNDKIMVGLIAEEVAEIDPRLVGYANGKPHSVQYEFLTAILVKAIQEQQAEIAQLKRRWQ